MVSPLWIAADTGDIDQVRLLLEDGSSVDIEIKDEAGATPLVQAVKNGHGDIVKALLDAGADPTVSSSHESIEQLTTDATILELLSSARAKKTQADTEATASPAAPGSAPEQTYLHPAPEDYQQNYTAYGQVPPPPGPYMYYPAPYPGAMLPDGSPAQYYPAPPPPPNGATQPSDAMGNGTLPPPEIARLIPCRYFPACRYGPSCIFAHPQGPFFQGPLPPPAQYSAHYDPMAHPPYAGYYSVPPQSPYSQLPSSAHPASSPQNPSHSPVSQPQHLRSGSEVTSPVQTPYNSTSAPPPMPYGIPVPGGYPAPGQMLPPMPLGMSPTQHPVPQPNGFMYSPTSPVVQSSTHRNDANLLNGSAQYPQYEGAAPNGVQHMQAPSQQEAYTNPTRPQLREGTNNLRRGSVRRMSGAGSSNRKPPCAFFPSGRCRNGDSCKFPHILPEPGESLQGSYVTKFGGRARAQTQPQGDQLSEKMAGLNLRSDGSPNGSQVNGQGQRGNVPKANGVRHEKRGTGSGRNMQQYSQHPSQRVPGADEFPVLGGSVTPPSRSPVSNPINGPTAAEVLKAPPPLSTKSERSSTDGTNTPSGLSETASVSKDPDPDGAPNGHINGVNCDMNASATEVKPLSFAAVATVSAANPAESANTATVSVSA
ncbi:hypothetical protein ACEPAG_424 [Sanghuangporus baumii]